MLGLVKSPPKDHSFFMIFWLLLSEDRHMPCYMSRVMIGVYLDKLVLGSLRPGSCFGTVSVVLTSEALRKGPMEASFSLLVQ